MNLKLSTLAVVLGLALATTQLYALVNPKAFSEGLRKFPRSTFWGYGLMLLGTVWFLWNLSQESISDFASYKGLLYLLFAAVGIGSCAFVQDFLAVRGLAVVLLLLAKLMVDTGRPHLPETSLTLIFQVWAYVFVIMGIWLTISPWRLRDWIDWSTADEKRFKLMCGARLAFGLLIAGLGFTKF